VYKTIQTLFYSLSVLMISSCGHNTNDTNGVKAVGEDFTAAWNLHDPKAISDLWTADGDFLSPWMQTDLIKGREAIEKYFAEEFKNTMKNSTISLTIDPPRLIDPETAFTEADFTITGMTISGVQAVPFNDHAVFILVKEDGDWKIKIARPY